MWPWNYFLAQTMPGEEVIPFIQVLFFVGLVLGVAACTCACLGKRKLGFRLAIGAGIVSVALVGLTLHANDWSLAIYIDSLLDAVLIVPGVPTALALIAVLILLFGRKRPPDSR